jgi:exodeoxyribonuclease VII large subunit
MNGLLRYHERLKRKQLKVVSYRDRMTHRMAHTLNAAQYKWRQNHEKLSVLGPQNVLSRGFSILRTIDGQIVRTYGDVKPGDIIEGILSQGSLKLRVEEVSEER